MVVCISCQQPLEVEIEDYSDDEDVEMGGQSSAGPSRTTYPDDVHLVSDKRGLLLSDFESFNHMESSRDEKSACHD